MTSICFDKKYIPFDEEKFIRQCMERFAEIRDDFGLDDDTLESVQANPLLERQLVPVLEGCNKHGIKEIEKRLPMWEVKNRKNSYYWGGIACFDFSSWNVTDLTADLVERMCVYYREECGLLYGKMEQIRHYEKIIRAKEELASSGDVKAMFFLGKFMKMKSLVYKIQQK